jgi:hypothetical protein
MENCTFLTSFETKIKDENIQDDIKKAILICDLYVEEKNQNWLHFRWTIWEEICRLMPIKTRQPYWPFGKLVYYNKRFCFGDLDIWVAHFWKKLNGGELWLENSYLEEYTYKKKNAPSNTNKQNKNLNKNKDTKSTNPFIHSKEYTKAKYLYLAKEEKKYEKEKPNKQRTRKQKQDKII